MSADKHQTELAGEEHPVRAFLPMNRWTVLAVLLVVGAILFLIPAVQQARMAAWRSASKNNLKQIGLAVHNYHDTHRLFPPGAIVDAHQQVYHSWMTQILPFLDASPLYSQINKNIPWDDPLNRPHFKSLYLVFLNPAIAAIRNCDGYGLSHYAGNAHVFYNNSSVAIRDVTDGTSNTLMAGEIKQNLPAWGDPSNRREIALGINQSPAGFGSPFEGGAIMMMLDGSVRFVSDRTDAAVLKRIGLYNDGQHPCGF